MVRLLVVLSLIVVCAACTSRRTGPRMIVDSGSSRGDSGNVDSSSVDSSVPMGCPAEILSTDPGSCSASMEGLMCPGMLQCFCGWVPTTCTCTEGSEFYFSCEGDCSACMLPDAGSPPDASTSDFCGVLYDRFEATECPVPITDTRASFIDYCETARNNGPGCAQELEAWAGCALSAPIECVDGVPATPTCPTLSEMCIPN